MAAALTVAVPSMVYTATLMTENAFYPLFLCAALAMVLWLERPTRLRTAIVLGVCLVAYLTRQQAVALLPALLTAPLLVGREGRIPSLRAHVRAGRRGARSGSSSSSWRRGRSPLGRLRRLRGGGPRRLLGRERWPSGSCTTSVSSSLSLGVIPFAALLLLALMVRGGLTERDRIFVAAAAQPVLLARARGGVFASEQTFRIEERNMFYVAPLFFDRAARLDRARPAATPAGDCVGSATSPSGSRSAIPYDDFIGLNAVSDTAALLPLGWLVEQGLALSDAGLVVLAGAVVTGLAFLFVPRRYALALPALVLVYFAVSQYPIVDEHRYRSAQHLFGGITMKHRDWIDRSVGRDADVACSVDRHLDEFTIWENEIFNRSIGDIYTTGPAVSRGSSADASLDRPEAPVTCRGPTEVACRCRSCSPMQPGSSGAPWSAKTGSSAWFSIASTARCGSWRSSTGSIRRTRGRGSASRTRATTARGHAGSRAAERLGVVR